MQDDKKDLTILTNAQLVAMAVTVGRTRSMSCADAIEAAGESIRSGADHRKCTLEAFAEVLRKSEACRLQATRDIRRELLRRTETMSDISDRFLVKHIPVTIWGEAWEIISIKMLGGGIEAITMSLTRGNAYLDIKRDNARAFVARSTTFPAPTYMPQSKSAPLLDVLRAIEGVADQMLPEHRAAFALTFAQALTPPAPTRKRARR